MPPPSIRKRRSSQGKRGRYYLLGLIVLVVAVGVGLYAYFVITAGTPDFVIAAPTALVIHAGSPTSSTVTINSLNQFSGTVQLTATGSSGLNVSISPDNVTGSGAAILTVIAAKAGNYTVTVIGTSGGLVHSITPSVATPVRATLQTSIGIIEVELYPNVASKTVANFVNLARSGLYNSMVWHRIVKGFVIQTGDPKTRNGTGDRTTWGSGGSSQTVPLEINDSFRNNFGYLGMARSADVNSGSSQFYINLNDNNSLDGKYTVFGKVVSGMDVAIALGNLPTTTQYSSEPQPADPSSAMLLGITISNTP